MTAGPVTSSCACSLRKAKQTSLRYRIARRIAQMTFLQADGFISLLASRLNPEPVAGFVILIYSMHTNLTAIPHNLQLMLDHLGYLHEDENFYILINFDFVYKDYNGEKKTLPKSILSKELIGKTVKKALEDTKSKKGLITYGGHAHDDNGVMPLEDVVVTAADFLEWIPEEERKIRKITFILDVCYVGPLFPNDVVPLDYSNRENVSKEIPSVDSNLLVLSATTGRDDKARTITVSGSRKKDVHTHGSFLYHLLRIIEEKHKPSLFEIKGDLETMYSFSKEGLLVPGDYGEHPCIRSLYPENRLSFAGLTANGGSGSL